MHCFKCGKHISHLVNIETGHQVYHLNKVQQYTLIEFIPDADIDEYRCPECDEVLFNNEASALKFIKKGGDTL